MFLKKNVTVKGVSFNSGYKESELPARLSDEEIRKLTEQAKGGSKEAKDKLIIGNLRYVISIVGRYCAKYPKKREDLMSVANLSLVNSVNKFPYDRHDNVVGYVVKTLHGDLMDFIRNDMTVHFPRYQLDKSDYTQKCFSNIDKDSTNTNDYIEQTRSTSPDDTLDIDDSIRHLPINTFEFLVLKHKLEGLSDVEIGVILGRNKARINQVKNQLKEKLSWLFDVKEKDVPLLFPRPIEPIKLPKKPSQIFWPLGDE